VEGEDAEDRRAAVAVEPEVGAGEEALAVQDRQVVIPPPALAPGDVDLEPVIESEQLRRPGAVADQVVEGREGDGAAPGLERVRDRDAHPPPPPHAPQPHDAHADDVVHARELLEHA
jgi:hypothetical protein